MHTPRRSRADPNAKKKLKVAGSGSISNSTFANLPSPVLDEDPARQNIRFKLVGDPPKLEMASVPSA